MELDQTSFPRIQGALLHEDDKKGLEFFNSKILVLDLWYFRCYPCIKAIPQLNNLNARFPDNLVRVIGVNIIDDKVLHRTYLEKFIKKNKVHYPSVYTSINSIPTIMVIDEDFNIVYSYQGYNENLEEEVTEVINKYLEKKG